MIAGWLLKIVIGIAILGVVILQVGSPIITHFQVDGAAHDAANDAAAAFLQHHNQDEAQAIANEDAAKENATVESFTADDSGVRVRLFKQAKPFLLKKFKWAKKWYEVRVSASSAGPGGR